MNPQTAAKINMARHAQRAHRSDGTAERWVYLYDHHDPNKAKFVGRVDPKTMDAVTALGLWQHYSPRFTDHFPDRAKEEWYKYEI